MVKRLHGGVRGLASQAFEFGFFGRGFRVPFDALVNLMNLVLDRVDGAAPVDVEEFSA